MAKGNNIGILTGGGDVPGLNSVIKSVVYRATEMGRTVIGIRKGWKGLTHMNHADTGEARLDRQLTRENTRTIDRSGGTVAAHVPHQSAKSRGRESSRAHLRRPTKETYLRRKILRLHSHRP